MEPYKNQIDVNFLSLHNILLLFAIGIRPRGHPKGKTPEGHRPLNKCNRFALHSC